MQNELDKVKTELKLRNYSQKTVKSYLGCLKEYFAFKKANPQELDAEVQAGIIKWLNAMPFAITWVDNAEAIKLVGLGKDALVTFGNVVPHDDQSFEVILDFRYNDENKTLVTYIFQQNGGNWQIVEFGGNG